MMRSERSELSFNNLLRSDEERIQPRQTTQGLLRILREQRELMAILRMESEIAVKQLSRKIREQSEDITLLKKLVSTSKNLAEMRAQRDAKVMLLLVNRTLAAEQKNKALIDENIRLKNKAHDKSELSPQRNRIFSETTSRPAFK